jgi:hypothetical protein
MADQDFPYTVIEDEEVIAKFKRIEDASSFAANREWQDTHHAVSLVIDRATRVSAR